MWVRQCPAVCADPPKLDQVHHVRYLWIVKLYQRLVRVLFGSDLRPEVQEVDNDEDDGSRSTHVGHLARGREMVGGELQS